MSEELPILITLSVIPVLFLKPAHEPALMPLPAGVFEVPPVLVPPVLVPPVLVPPVLVPPVTGCPEFGSTDVPVFGLTTVLPFPPCPSTRWFALSASLGEIEDPPQAVGTSSMSATAPTPSSRRARVDPATLRTAVLLTPELLR